MKVDQAMINDFSGYYHEGINPSGCIATVCCGSLERTSEEMGITLKEASGLLRLIEVQAEAINKADLMTMAAVKGGADSHLLTFWLDAMQFDVFDFLDDDLEDVDLFKLKESGYGRMITEFKRGAKGELAIKFLDKNVAFNNVQALKRSSSAMQSAVNEFSMIKFFSDTEVDLEKNISELEKLK